MRKVILAAASAVIFGVLSTAGSSPAYALGKVVSAGTKVCGGAYVTRGNGEIVNTTYNLRNTNSLRTILITRVQSFNGSGTSMYDSSVSGLPGGMLNILPKNGGTRFMASDVTPGGAPISAANLPMQVRVDYKILGGNDGGILRMGGVVSLMDPSGNTLSRHNASCNETPQLY